MESSYRAKILRRNLEIWCHGLGKNQKTHGQWSYNLTTEAKIQTFPQKSLEKWIKGMGKYSAKCTWGEKREVLAWWREVTGW